MDCCVCPDPKPALRGGGNEASTCWCRNNPAPPINTEETTVAVNVLETVPVTLPDGEAFFSLLASRVRPGGRRIVVHRKGNVLYDTGDCRDQANAENTLQAWLDRVSGEPGIHF